MCLNINVPTLASWSFDKHRQILTIFGITASGHFQKWCAYSTSLVPSIYLLHLLLNSSDGNDAMLLSFNICKWWCSFSMAHIIASSAPCPWFWIFIYKNGHVKILWLIDGLSRSDWKCINWKDIMHQPSRLPNLGFNTGMRVQDSRPRHQRLETTLHWHTGKHIIKHHQQSDW